MSVFFNAVTKIVSIFHARPTLLLIFSFLCVLSLTADGQEKDSVTHQWELGIDGGLALNQFSQNQPQNGLNTGYTAGVNINYKIASHFSLQLEVNLLQQGGQMIRFKDDTRLGLDESFDSKNVKNSSFKLNSLEVPLLIQYTFPIKQDWKPAVYTGASYAYTYQVRESYQKTGDLLPGEDIISTVSGTQNATDLFNRSRLNFIVGANVKLPLCSKLQLLIDMRYLSGLTTARENYSYMDKAGFDTDVRTSSFLSKLGIVMPL